MFAPAMMAAPPATTYPAPTYAPRQQALPPAVPANAPRAAAAARPQPVIRAQAPEEPKPARPPLLTLPSPEQLGVALRPVENANDWTALHARMKELGIASFHADTLSDGRARFTCWLPLDQAGRTQRIEAVADSELAAAQLALQRAGQSRAGQP